MDQATVDRMCEELDQLEGRLHKLDSFMLTETFRNLREVEKMLLQTQHIGMKMYRIALESRLDLYVRESTPV